MDVLQKKAAGFDAPAAHMTAPKALTNQTAND